MEKISTNQQTWSQWKGFFTWHPERGIITWNALTHSKMDEAEFVTLMIDRSDGLLGIKKQRPVPTAALKSSGVEEPKHGISTLAVR